MLSRRLMCNRSTIEEEASVEEIREAVQKIGKIYINVIARSEHL